MSKGTTMVTYHLPLQGLNHVPLQLQTFNTPWNKIRVESRSEALCVEAETDRAGLQTVRYSWELILWAQFLYFLISRKALKSFMVATAPCGFCQKYVFDCMYSSFTKITYILTLTPTSLEQFLRAIWGAISQAIVLILPHINLNLKL